MAQENDELKDLFGKGFEIPFGNIIEWLIIQQKANTYLLTTLLKRQIELERLSQGEKLDIDSVNKELQEIVDSVAKKATEDKNSLLAKWFLEKGE